MGKNSQPELPFRALVHSHDFIDHTARQRPTVRLRTDRLANHLLWSDHSLRVHCGYVHEARMPAALTLSRQGTMALKYTPAPTLSATPEQQQGVYMSLSMT